MPDIIGQPFAAGYCVDASCTGNPGLMEYKGVQTTSQHEIFHQGPFENGSNTIGGFLPVADAGHYSKNEKSIYQSIRIPRLH
ncbi:MAG: hypothetical protein NTZ74_11980 [Chloroflexi bacterium]|nr:hypothetical protein [Chloroflexota bacterium]